MPRGSTSALVFAVRSISGTPAAATERMKAGWSTPLTSRAVPLFRVPSELNQRRTTGVTRTGSPIGDPADGRHLGTDLRRSSDSCR